MIFRKLVYEDLSYIYSWLDEDDYLRRGVLDEYVKKGLGYGIEVDGKIEAIGLINLIKELRYAWLLGARVRREMRRKGLGEFLTRRLIEESIRLGAQRVALSTSLDNKAVIRIAEKIGMRNPVSIIMYRLRTEYLTSYPTGLIAEGDLIDLVEKIVYSEDHYIIFIEHPYVWIPVKIINLKDLVYKDLVTICVSKDLDAITFVYKDDRGRSWTHIVRSSVVSSSYESIKTCSEIMSLDSFNGIILISNRSVLWDHYIKNIGSRDYEWGFHIFDYQQDISQF